MTAARDSYRTIVADPPWRTPGDLRFKAPSGRHAGGYSPQSGVNTHSRRYGSMSHEELMALRPAAADDAHLYLWTTNAMMVQAHEVARAWGFEPKTIITWGKIQPDGSPSMKMGYYFRGATEHVVFAVRGSLRTRGPALPTLMLLPRLGQHSAKPDAFYDMVEIASPGPYLELFARRARFGWDYWGDESLATTEMPAA